MPDFMENISHQEIKEFAGFIHGKDLVFCAACGEMLLPVDQQKSVCPGCEARLMSMPNSFE